MIKTYIKQISAVFLFLIATSCESDKLEPELETADGGGTLTSYIAYTIESTDPTGSNVFGRIVFWKTDLDQTLVQISLYNTVDGLLHPADIVNGLAGAGTTVMMAIDDVDGSTGELSTNKFFLIADTAFYDSIASLDAHVSISLSSTDATIVATGNIGVNADPVESN